jgi:hypothetical protein
MYRWLAAVAYAAGALVSAGLFLSLAWTAIDVVRAQYLGGIEGTVTVEECRLSEAGEASELEWECIGEFISDDGSVRIPGVEIQPALPERPTAPVDALVSGPSAGVAQLPEPTRAWVSVAAPVVFAWLAVGFGRAALVRVRGDASRAHRWASRATGITSPVEEVAGAGRGRRVRRHPGDLRPRRGLGVVPRRTDDSRVRAGAGRQRVAVVGRRSVARGVRQPAGAPSWRSSAAVTRPGFTCSPIEYPLSRVRCVRCCCGAVARASREATLGASRRGVRVSPS